MISTSNSVPSAARDPGWGDRDRPSKALAILATCRRVIGSDFSRTRWLDIGCGCGDIAASIAPHVGHITGIDPSPWRRWPALRALHPNLEFIQGSFEAAEKIHPPDVIVCNQVYEHVEDPWGLDPVDASASLNRGATSILPDPTSCFRSSLMCSGRSCTGCLMGVR